MNSTLRRTPLALLPLLLLAGPASAVLPAPKAPPGFNVHLVTLTSTTRFWRGGAPKRDTVEALARDARERGVTVTFVDLRKPANSDDRSGKGGRLAPTEEQALAEKHGLRYEAISALDRQLPDRLEAALKRGDIYMHCMYGVNRTGFAAARYAVATGTRPSTTSLGKRDWKQGEAFQRRLQPSKSANDEARSTNGKPHR
jgi:hypothetical protein